MKINLDAIDREQFNVVAKDGRVLITPQKSKHVWTLDEMWYRSCLCAPDGTIISMGFPKFMNYHEQPEVYDNALVMSDQILYLTKEDGSLIIVSWDPEFGFTIRTRGSMELGDFKEPVMALITDEILAAVKAHPRHSFLFEYTGPDNQIVLPYDIPELVLLGIVDHGAASYIGSPWMPLYTHPFDLDRYGGRDMCVRTPVMHSVPHGMLAFFEFMKDVQTWEGEEGVVVSCMGADPLVPTLFKVKAHWYVMIHALKFQMNERRLRKLLTLRPELTTFEELQSFLYALGYDFEVSAFLKEHALIFFERLKDAFAFRAMASDWLEFKGMTLGDRGAIVRELQEYLRTFDNAVPSWLFASVMSELDGKATDHLVYAHAAQEAPMKVRGWLKDREHHLEGLLKTPKDFEEEEDATS